MRMSAGDLDAYRYWRDTEDSTPEDFGELLARLRRQSPPTEAMEAGKVFHAALEHSDPGEVGVFERKGYRFEVAVDVEIDIPDIRECKATRDYVIDGVTVTLVGVVDAMHGRRIDDHKTTARFDPERYLDSYQWRCYLEIFDADEFRWNVFEWSESAKKPKHYTVRAVHQLTMYRYPELAADLERELREFVAFAREHLPERFAFAEAA